MDVKIDPKRVLKINPKTYPKMDPKMHPQTTIGPGVHFRLPGQVPQNPSRMAISTGFQPSLGHLLEIWSRWSFSASWPGAPKVDPQNGSRNGYQKWSPKLLQKSTPKSIPKTATKWMPKSTSKWTPKCMPKLTPKLIPKGVPKWTPKSTPKPTPKMDPKTSTQNEPKNCSPGRGSTSTGLDAQPPQKSS